MRSATRRSKAERHSGETAGPGAEGARDGGQGNGGRLLRVAEYERAAVIAALAHIRNPDLSPALASQVYVTRAPTETPTGKYLGVAHFQRLLREPPGTLVSSVLDTNLVPVGPDAPLSVVTRTFAAYNLVALPVVDENGRLIGAVTVDDVVDHMLPEDWRENDGDDRG